MCVWKNVCVCACVCLQQKWCACSCVHFHVDSRHLFLRMHTVPTCKHGHRDGLWVQQCMCTPALLQEFWLFLSILTTHQTFCVAVKSALKHMQAEDTRGQAFPLLPPSAWDLCYCYVYANSLWHNSFETVENWIVPLGQTFRPPPWLYSSATVNWVQRWLHTLYFRERLQLGNNFCTGKTNANSWQKHWSCLVVQPPIWRNIDCAENFFGHPRSK